MVFVIKTVLLTKTLFVKVLTKNTIIKGCHSVCLNCIGGGYGKCKKCSGNREMVNGMCICPPKSLETYKEDCEENSELAILTEKTVESAMYANYIMAFLCKIS